MTDLKMTVAERTEFLRGSHVAVIAVERADNKPPLSVPIWYRLDEAGDLEIWTELGSMKERFIREAGRFSLTVHHDIWPYQFVSVGGPASIREGITREGVIPIVERYVSADEMDAYLDANYTEDAVLITMRPKVWNSVDYNKE
ncbi:pyridoxamine 5'-phosphate oxidase [Rhodococcus sp. IEGM 1354]|uniref:pyridoxamine 5'-phosphate oxidase family protein n=1 Tax=Rhodococcus sp. IEGM 1354 TaxID=3047088 RepID=UPI0024B873DB|nr:pyridoxamine 5'-phosphate oxidase [Rhodococcus sp. IEGM 1354]MDI9933674.1 pyridoxamine 5'-phosphate oxidase [Rhodococcus sp. IEGM 1354]